MKIALVSDLAFLSHTLAQMKDVQVVILPASVNLSGSIIADALLCTVKNHEDVPQILQMCPDLKWVHILGTGVDNFPVKLCKDKLITCSRGATAGPISEWVLAVMLAHEKQLIQRRLQQPPKTWYMANLGSLEKKTLGLIGFGAIGQAVAKKALAFDMNVIAKVRTHRKSPSPDITFEKDIRTVISKSDHLVLALPSTPKSRGLINSETLALMKPEAHLVNISRGDLVDQDALRKCLDAGGIAGASLDVTTPEPLPAGHWMYQHPCIFLSPHISWSSPQSQTRIIDMFYDNVKAYVSGRALTGGVDLQAEY